LAISREHKVELVEQYKELIEKSQGTIFVDYRGLQVSQMEQLRRSLRESGSTVHVVKNRLMKIVLSDVGMQTPDEWLDGPTAVAFCYDEVPPIAKAVTEFAKDAPLTIKGGILSGEALSVDQVKSLADLPSREMLLAQALGTINAPATQVVGVVASGIRQVLNVLQAYVDKLEEGGAPAPQSA
jgi:large subunit ribosomal protein L10